MHIFLRRERIEVDGDMHSITANLVLGGHDPCTHVIRAPLGHSTLEDCNGRFDHQYNTPDSGKVSPGTVMSSPDDTPLC